MTKNKYPDYPVVVRKLSKEEGDGYLAEHPDLPGCMSDGPTPEEAIRESRDALKSYLESMKKYGDPWPKPNEARGEWRQRAPKTLHRRLTVQAEKEGVSLNTLVVALLAEGLGKRQSKR